MADARASVEGVAPVLLGAGTAPAWSSGSGVRGEPLISKAVGNGCEERFVVLFQEEILDRDINPFQVAETEDLVDQPSPLPQEERTISDRWVDQAVVPSQKYGDQPQPEALQHVRGSREANSNEASTASRVRQARRRRLEQRRRALLALAANNAVSKKNGCKRAKLTP